jgi:hypothetical protein
MAEQNKKGKAVKETKHPDLQTAQTVITKWHRNKENSPIGEPFRAKTEA